MARTGELTVELGKAADPRSETLVGDRAAVFGHRLRLSRRGAREHRSAGAVEVSRQDVDDVDEPARERSELLGAGAEAPVANGPLGGCEVPREGADVLGGDSGGHGDGLRGEGLGEVADGVDAVGEAREPARRGESFGEEHVDEREQEVGIAAGLDGEVSIGDRRGLRSPGIDDDEHAPPLAVGAQARAHVGSRHQAAVRDQRVRSQDEEEVRAVDVGDRKQPGVAVQEAAAQVLRELVRGRAGEHPLRVEGLDEERRVEHGADVVARRISDVGRDGVLSALLPDLAQA
jgi:hypothetical protein